MRKIKITDTTILQIILVCTGVCIGYLLLWTLFDPPGMEQHEMEEAPNHNGVVKVKVQDICTSGHEVGWVAGISVAEIVGLLYGSMLAYQNRDIHDAFAESKWTGMAIYNMMIQMVFVAAATHVFQV